MAASAVLMRLFCRFDSITTVFADGGYTSKLIDWEKVMFDYSVKIVNATNNICFAYCPSAGLSNAPSPGSTGHAVSAKTTNFATPPPKL